MSDIRVTVEFFAQARTIAGLGAESLTLAATMTLRDLLSELARRHGPEMEKLLRSSGMIFAVGGRQTSIGDEAELRDGETVAIVPPISGGAG